MQKTKLGVSVGVVGAAAYFMGYFSGYTVALLLAGYILLFEDNLWLKKTVVKAVALMVIFSFTSAIVSFVPNILGFVGDVAYIFGASFSIDLLYLIANAVDSAINITEKALFLLLGVKALGQRTIGISFVDDLIDKSMA